MYISNFQYFSPHLMKIRDTSSDSDCIKPIINMQVITLITKIQQQFTEKKKRKKKPSSIKGKATTTTTTNNHPLPYIHTHTHTNKSTNAFQPKKKKK